MTALVTCGEADVLAGRVHAPGRGTWWAELALDTVTVPGGKVDLKATDGFSLTGTITTAGVDQTDTVRVRMVGGAGGLGKLIQAAAYQNAQLRTPLDAIMSATGETLSSTVDASVTGLLLTDWTHATQTGARALDLLAHAAGKALRQVTTWRVLADGTIWLGVETWLAKAMPAGCDILNQFPEEGRFELGPQTPEIMPGVNLAGVGNVAAADHWIRHDQIRTDIWISSPATAFRSLVRAAVGLPSDPGEPPDLARLGLYRARVDVCATDGSTLDVSPEDTRFSPEKHVKLLVGIPGAVMQVQPGAVVYLGWERGDPSKPYCVPCWEAGATVTKLVFNAQAMRLGGEIGSKFLATKDDIDAIFAAINGAAVVAMDGGAAFKTNIIAAWPVGVGTQVVRAK